MTLLSCTRWWQRPKAQRDRAGQRGPGALASSGARAGRAPVRGPALDAGLRRWGSWALIVTLAVLLPVSPHRRSCLGKARLVAGRGRGSREGHDAGFLPG